MKFKDAMRNMRELQLMTKGLLLSNIILGAGFVWALATISGERERIVLVPPMLDAKAEVAWNSANKEYIKGFGMYIATLVGTSSRSLRRWDWMPFRHSWTHRSTPSFAVSF